MKRNSTEKSLKQTNSSRSTEKLQVSQNKQISSQLPPQSNRKCMIPKNKKLETQAEKNTNQITEKSEIDLSEHLRNSQISSSRIQNIQSEKENINHQQSFMRNYFCNNDQNQNLKSSRSTSSFQDKYQEIFVKLSGQNNLHQNEQKNERQDTERDQQLNNQLGQNKKIFNQIQSQNCRSYNPSSQNPYYALSEQDRQSNQLQSSQTSIQSMKLLQSSLNLNRNEKQINYVEAINEEKEQKYIENSLFTKLDSTQYNNTNKHTQLNNNCNNCDLINHKNAQIQDLTKQITQLRIQNEKLQRKILELEYELENSKNESQKLDNVQFQEKVLEEKQISIRKSELEIEDITRELKKESQLIIKQRQLIQQDALINKKQRELLVKEQEKLNEEGKKLKLWEEKIQEQDRLLREKIIKFENRDELLIEKENSLKKFETQIEQKRIFVLQLIERLGQHDEQLYLYAKQCEQRCEKIDQFQNILYNQVLHHDDLDLRMEGLKLNESIFQRKMDLEISSCINQVQKLKEKENNLEKREKSIKQKQERAQLQQQNQQKLAKSLDKPISFSEYSNLKQQAYLSKTQKSSLNKISSNETIPQSTCSSTTLQVSSQNQGVHQLQFKNKNNQHNNQQHSSKNFQRISQQQQQNQSLQINGTNQQNDTYQNDGQKNKSSSRKRRSESHQNLSNQALSRNSDTNNINFTLQNDQQQQTTFLSFDNNLDLTVTQNQINQNQIIKLNQFASQEDISVVLPPQNLQSNGILMTSYHIDEEIAYFCQDTQKEADQIKQISIIASPQQHYSEQARQQQTLQDQYQTFQKENSTENILSKAIHSGSSGSKQSELKIDLSNLQTKTDNQIDRQHNQQSMPSSNSQFLSVKYPQPIQQMNVFTNQFNPCQIANEIIQDDNLLSNRDYCNADELELIRKNRKINQTPQTSSKQQKLTHEILQQMCQNKKQDNNLILKEQNI
ncbi:hypothetical protein ABPG72_014807 [Tetrahymena utriculariae]